MCVPSQMNPSNVKRFVSSAIETVSSTIQIPSASSMQIAVVYRSPSVPQEAFIAVLTRLLQHVSVCSTRCVILGDFNCVQHQPLLKAHS